jgi:hypothetical protein
LATAKIARQTTPPISSFVFTWASADQGHSLCEITALPWAQEFIIQKALAGGELASYSLA